MAMATARDKSCVVAPAFSVFVPVLSDVVPAKAGTHTLCPIGYVRLALIASLWVMGPRLRGDDIG
jgi:hypothetical protein